MASFVSLSIISVGSYYSFTKYKQYIENVKIKEQEYKNELEENTLKILEKKTNINEKIFINKCFNNKQIQIIEKIINRLSIQHINIMLNLLIDYLNTNNLKEINEYTLDYSFNILNDISVCELYDCIKYLIFRFNNTNYNDNKFNFLSIFKDYCYVKNYDYVDILLNHVCPEYTFHYEIMDEIYENKIKSIKL